MGGRGGIGGVGGLGVNGAAVGRVGASARIGPGLLEPTDAPYRWVLKTPATSPSPRRVPGAMAYDSARGVTVLFGGFDLAGGGTISDTWEWNGSNWTQRSAGGGGDPAARYVAQMVYDANPNRGVVVLFGGFDGSSTVFGDTWEWDGSQWAQRSPSTSPRLCAASAERISVRCPRSAATTAVAAEVVVFPTPPLPV